MNYTNSIDIEKLFRWLEIREQNGLPFPTSLLTFQIDATKSSLLRRILNGDEPLPEPPPCSFSYPWYYLVENGSAQSSDVWIENEILQPKTALIINQFIWEVKERTSEDEFICSYDGSNSRWCVKHVKKSPVQWDNIWTITRLPESADAELVSE